MWHLYPSTLSWQGGSGYQGECDKADLPELAKILAAYGGTLTRFENILCYKTEKGHFHVEKDKEQFTITGVRSHSAAHKVVQEVRDIVFAYYKSSMKLSVERLI
jgi:hypothetical protein